MSYPTRCCGTELNAQRFVVDQDSRAYKGEPFTHLLARSHSYWRLIRAASLPILPLHRSSSTRGTRVCDNRDQERSIEADRSHDGRDLAQDMVDGAKIRGCQTVGIVLKLLISDARALLDRHQWRNVVTDAI